MRRIAPMVSWVVAAVALTAIAAWPAYVGNGTKAARAASLPTPAPVHADYLERDRLIAFWERAHAEHRRGDMLSPTNLSAQYLQRYRERGDPGDVVRAVHLAHEALRAQPYGNSAAELALGAAYVALHRFAGALAVTRSAERYLPGEPSVLVREASIDLELGRYAAASSIIARLRTRRQPERVPSLDVETLIARYDELTGHLARARQRFERVVAYGNARYDAPAQQRAWFWFHAGELAFEAGDNDGAIAAERQALEVFPNFAEANRMLARVLCSLQRWQECLGAASASAAVVPYPEVLGYEVDAERALGDQASAAATDDLIRTIERIGNAQRVSDRLLAIYYSEHGERTADAYAIAKRELLVRDDVYAEDTLAWAAAMGGHWAEAAARSRAALRYGTENALFRYHAGVIALHNGDRERARIWLRQALALNAEFHPFYAADARSRLAELPSRPARRALGDEGVDAFREIRAPVTFPHEVVVVRQRHRVAQPARAFLRHSQCQRRQVGELRRDRECPLVVSGGTLGDLRQEAGSVSCAGIEQMPGKKQKLGGVEADERSDARQISYRDAVPERARDRHADAGVRRTDPHVAARRDRRTAAGAGSRDRGDRRNGNPLERPHHAFHAFLIRDAVLGAEAAELRDVGPRDERRVAAAREDHRAHGAIGREFAGELAQLVPHGEGHRVACFGTIDRHAHDAALEPLEPDHARAAVPLPTRRSISSRPMPSSARTSAVSPPSVGPAREMRTGVCESRIGEPT
ncbi:MAG: hypothetical protein JWN27_4070 [Candidatus Eremiobacteraeota bacterium]|nr:hypothetical protein [Candidatus Eremiobacteraeota bacterium]